MHAICFRTSWRHLAVAAVAAAAAGPADAAGPVLTLPELFGVSHPLQVVVFDADRPPAIPHGVLKCSTGEQTPFQVVSGNRVALLTDLPPGVTKSWSLQDAAAAAADDRRAVVVTRDGPVFRVTNDMTGVAIPAGAEGFDGVPAPIQGLRWRDGSWTATGPNRIHGDGLSGPTLIWVERGPVKVVARLDYGTHACTIELQAGQPSVLVEDEGTAKVEYSLNVALGLDPDEGRYHVERGERVVRLDVGKARRYGRMSVWDPWAQQQDRGDGWQLYNREAGGSANVFAVYPGRASRIVRGNSGGPEVFTGPPDAIGKPTAGVTVRLAGGKRVRIPWNLFVGLKGRDWNPDPKFVDSNTPARIQGYVKQYNLHSGINLNKLLAYRLEDYPDPPRGYGAMYMPREAVEAMTARIRTDKAFYDKLYADGYTRPLFDMWRNDDTKSVRSVADHVLRFVSPYPTSGFNALNGYVNGWGLWNPHYAYWVGGGSMANKYIWIDQLLARKELTADERRRVKATAALFGGILWDDDFVPLSTYRESGLNLGTPNMPVQQMGMRHQAALFLSEHPLMKDRLRGIADDARGQFHGQVNEHGAHMGCPHYIGAAMWPTLNTLLQIKQAGVADLFRADDRVAKFAEFYMQLGTPPDPRTGGRRHLIAAGDSEVNDPLLLAGLMATGYADTNPALAGRLMGMWDQSGRHHDPYYGTTAVKIDERIAPRDPALGSADFPGYYTVLRSGWGTKHESAAWFVNGDYYKDHYHNDKGEVILYAHGVPLSVDFGSMYSPRCAGGMMKSRLLPAATDWAASPASVKEEAGNWGGSRSYGFRAAPDGGRVSASFTGYGGQWTRTLSLAELSPGRPVFVVRDGFTKGPMVFSLNLMCEDAVETPEGRKKPGDRFTLGPGATRIRCVGQTFPGHFSKGIDWDVWVVGPEPHEAALSEWSHTNRLPERQVILRIKGTEGFRVVIVPYTKGARPTDPVVGMSDDRIVIKSESSSVTVAPDGTTTPIRAE